VRGSPLTAPTLAFPPPVLAYCCSRGLLFTIVVHQGYCCSVVTVNNNNTVQKLTFGNSIFVPQGFYPPRAEIDPRSTRDRHERSTQHSMPQSPLSGGPLPPHPERPCPSRVANGVWGGGCEKRTGEAGEGGVHSEDCRPRRGFYPPREDRRGEGVGSNSPRNISPPQDPSLPPSWSHHLEPQSWLRTLSLRSVPHYVSPSSGHAILCSQGKWGRGAVPLV
jgi:hypothetical protein